VDSNNQVTKRNYGLINMEERAKLLNADLKMESFPYSGTKIIL